MKDEPNGNTSHANLKPNEFHSSPVEVQLGEVSALQRARRDALAGIEFIFHYDSVAYLEHPSTSNFCLTGVIFLVLSRAHLTVKGKTGGFCPDNAFSVIRKP